MSQKIIFFVTSLESGGIENYLLRFLKDNCHEFDKIYVFCKSGRGGLLESEYVSLSNVHIIKQSIGFFNPIDFVKLSSFLKSNAVDAVCDFTGNFAGQIMLIAKLAGIKKRISFYRGSTDRFVSNSIKQLFNSFVKTLVFSYSTDILSNSKAALNHFFTKKWENDSRFEVIYNGINANDFRVVNDQLRRELNIPSGSFVVGHTGRYNRAKNHPTILAVAEALIKENPHFYFILCGNKVKESLQESIKAKGLEKNILVFENRSDIPDFLNTMDCYFFPSITEGQPNSLIEAMLMNIPIVASNIDPIKETVPVEYHDYLTPPMDVEAFKNNILKIARNNFRPSFQTWAIENYDSKRLFKKFLDRIR